MGTFDFDDENTFNNPFDNPFGSNPKDKKKPNKDYDPGAWRRPYDNPVHDSHIWDNGNFDHDGDGYRDGSVGDSDLLDE